MISDYPLPLITYNTLSFSTTTGFLYHDSNNNKWLITARHNLYPAPCIPPPEGHHEVLIQKLVLRFKGSRTYSHEWELSQEDLLKHGRISVNKVDIAGINLTELAEKEYENKENLLDKFFFTAKDLSKADHEYDLGNRMIVLGFRVEYDFDHTTCPEIYQGEIIAITEKDVGPSDYRQFLFAVSAFCPRGISGGPVILDGSYNSNGGIVLLGVSSGYNHETNKGMISYSNQINEIIGSGIKLHK